MAVVLAIYFGLFVMRISAQLGVDPNTGITLETKEATECEEAWDYMEFLKNINDDVNEILVKTLHNTSVVEESLDGNLRQTLDQVLKIQTSISERLSAMKRRKIVICDEYNLRQGSGLTKLRESLMDILLSLVEKGPSMEQLKEGRGNLLRFTVSINNESIRALSIGDIVTSPVASLKTCKCSPDSPSSCNCSQSSLSCPFPSVCAAEVIEVTKARMEAVEKMVANSEDMEEASRLLQEEVINYIEDINQKSTTIIENSVLEFDLDQCDQKRLDVYEKLKGPLWMVVRSAISRPSSELMAMLEVLGPSLDDLQDMYCGKEALQRQCQIQEIEATKEFIEKIDEIIQKTLFKKSNEKTKEKALIGFIEINKLFDNRIRKLFIDKMTCPKEVDQIKEIYIPLLEKCTRELMGQNLDLSQSSRVQRIRCINHLRTTMDGQIFSLLQSELIL